MWFKNRVSEGLIWNDRKTENSLLILLALGSYKGGKEA